MPLTLEAHLVAASHGDERAFAAVYEKVAPTAFGLAARILKDRHHAEEIVQEVFLEAWRSAHSFDPKRGSAKAWLMTMVHRRSVDRVRSTEAWRRRDTTHTLATRPTPTDETAHAVHATMEARAIRTAVTGLSSCQRQAIELAYFDGYTYNDVSQLLQVPLGTVKTRIRDGLIKLREGLATTGLETVEA